MAASDPTPREVIAGSLANRFALRMDGSWSKVWVAIGPESAGLLTSTILTALAAAGYEVVRIDREPDTPEITAAMVEAGAMALSGYSSVEWPLIHEDERALERDRTQTILTAALKARGEG